MDNQAFPLIEHAIALLKGAGEVCVDLGGVSVCPVTVLWRLSIGVPVLWQNEFRLQFVDQNN